MAKLGLIIFTSWFLSRRVQEEKMSILSLCPVLFILGPSIGMILLEPDRGVAAHLCIAIALLWFFSGGKKGHFITLSLLGSVAIGTMVAINEEAKSRVVNFVTGKPEFQYQQALEGLSRGGLFGVGLGEMYSTLGNPYPIITNGHCLLFCGCCQSKCRLVIECYAAESLVANKNGYCIHWFLA